MQSLVDIQTEIEHNAAALGYEVVEVERGAQGLLRVTIDRADHQSAITVEDCERLSRQLSLALLTSGMDYERLEVSSPGIDRPLKKIADFERFVGQEAQVKLRQMVAGQRAFEGVLAPVSEESLGLEIETPQGKSILRFKLADVEKARLKLKVDFKRKVS